MKWFFWIIPLLLFIFQLVFTLNSQTQIRYEELAESIRNPFWLQKGLIYDGSSSNVGWYGLNLLVYNLFGFDIHTAKFIRLMVHLVSLLCLAAVLKKYLGGKAWLPLLVIGLSPTWLFLNTLQTSYGTDLQYFPIILLLITHARRRLLRLIGWGLAMWAWMSYPTFIFYLPALVVLRRLAEGSIFFATLRMTRGLRMTTLLNLLAFLTPLGLAFLFVKNNSLLFYDQKLDSGIFRGAGVFQFDIDNISHNLGGLVKDLFIQGQSYHFELNAGEFSLIFPILTLVFVLIITFLAIRHARRRLARLVMLIWVMLLLSLVLTSLTSDPSGAPGMRRYTPVLAAFYALFVIAWQSGIFKKWGMVILSLLLIHHLIVYPVNLVHLKDPSPQAESYWFKTAATPRESLQVLLEQVKKEDLKLVCLDELKQPIQCRLSEVYSAVAGSCLWNDLDCHNILGFDIKTGKFISLSVDLWNNYYFEH